MLGSLHPGQEVWQRSSCPGQRPFSWPSTCLEPGAQQVGSPGAKVGGQGLLTQSPYPLGSQVHPAGLTPAQGRGEEWPPDSRRYRVTVVLTQSPVPAADSFPSQPLPIALELPPHSTARAAGAGLLRERVQGLSLAGGCWSLERACGGRGQSIGCWGECGRGLLQPVGGGAWPQETGARQRLSQWSRARRVAAGEVVEGSGGWGTASL